MTVHTPTEQAEPDGEHARTRRDASTLRNGLVGGLAGLALAFLPFSTALGGVLAGYLEGGSASDGAVAGTVAGCTALAALAVGALVVVALDVTVPGPALPPVVFGLLAAFVALAYVLGSSVLGGAVGASLRTRVVEA